MIYLPHLNPTNVRFFHTYCIKWSETGHILYYRGANTFVAPCSSTKTERDYVKFTLEDAIIPKDAVNPDTKKQTIPADDDNEGKDATDPKSGDKLDQSKSESSFFTTPDGRSYTEEEFNTVKEAMMDVYKRIKNNDLDFLLDDENDDDLATADYDDDYDVEGPDTDEEDTSANDNDDQWS